MVRQFVPINGVDAPADIQKKCIKRTAERFGLPQGRVKEIIKNNVYMLLQRDTIIDQSPSGKPKRVPKKTLHLKNLECLSHSSRPLYEHQVRVTEALQKQRGIIVVHSVGSGKTLTAATAAHCFLENNPDGVVFVVTPTSLVDNFREEIERSFHGKNIRRYIFYTHAKFAKYMKNDLIDQDVLKKSMVIIDEIHNYRKEIPKYAVKSWAQEKRFAQQNKRKGRGKRKKARKSRIPSGFHVQQGIKKAQKVIGLTATPFVNALSDLTSIVSIVTGKDLFSMRTRKKSEFRVLMDNCKDVFSFYEIEKGDPRFPSYTIHKVELVMPRDYYEKYMAIESGMVNKSAKISDAFYAEIRVASNKIDNRTNSPKVLWTLNKIEAIVRNGGRVVVFSNFLDSGIKIIENQLSKKGIRCNFITGKVKRSRRQGIVNDYNTGKMPVLLISKAGGEGLDLKQTTAVIMLEPTWNSASRTQIFGRGIRNGSHDGLPERRRRVDCFILMMVKPKGVEDSLPSGDKFVYDITEDKHIASEAVMSRLEELSIEGKKLTRWVPEKQSYHILPTSSGLRNQEIMGEYYSEGVPISKQTANILNEINSEEDENEESDFFDLEADEDVTWYENSGDEEPGDSQEEEPGESQEEEQELLGEEDFFSL